MIVTLTCFGISNLAATNHQVKYEDSPKVHHDHFGRLMFGEPLTDTQLAFTVQSRLVDDCQYIRFDAYPNVSVMVVNHVIERIDSNQLNVIDTDSPFYELASKSLSLTDFSSKYPDIEVEPHEYENGVYLRWYNPNKTKAIVVDYINNQIDVIKAGLVPSVLYIEGCA
ncbi:hypothetical protein [Marinomonas sp. TW1]|uniref:hypothetical protein n=1 Tax=Marinomonas sp. TW1 TaxID=1561203 RepID=UPI0007AFCD27|nr:hypothetical protein [Marinomonas sp. TW1]KZN15238.1 hypothetical protein OA79_00125 [Marinomonas sp. TW1]